MTEEASTYNGVNIVYSINGVGKIGQRKIKLDHLLTVHPRINSTWIKDLNFRPETIKILEENIGSKVSYIALRNFLSDISPQARETRKKIQMGLHQTKKVFHSEGNHPLNEKIIHRMEGHIHGYI